VNPRIAKHLLFIALLAFASITAHAKGRLGFSVDVASTEAAPNALAEMKVTAVQPGSPAAAAGLKTGDLITELNGKKIQGADAMEIRSAMGSVKAGEHVKLVVLRAGGKRVPVEIVAGP
jgi:S1-C subfamily serine protease